MEKCTSKNLDESIEEMKEYLEEDPNLDREMERLKEVFNPQVVSYCLEKYIGSELDRNGGARGLGRVSTQIPRFAYHFRKYLSSFSEEDMSVLYGLLQNLILQAYIMHAVATRGGVKEPKAKDKEGLYHVWIPCIYVTTPANLGSETMSAIEGFTMAGFNRLVTFLLEKGIKKKFLAKGKTRGIFFYLILSGYALRRIEVGKEYYDEYLSYIRNK